MVEIYVSRQGEEFIPHALQFDQISRIQLRDTPGSNPVTREIYVATNSQQFELAPRYKDVAKVIQFVLTEPNVIKLQIYISNDLGVTFDPLPVYDNAGKIIQIRYEDNINKTISVSQDGKTFLPNNVYYGLGQPQIMLIASAMPNGPTTTPTGIQTGKVVGKQIYLDANPPHTSGTTGGGDVEHHSYESGGSSDRREWEIKTPHLNCEVTAYFKVTEKKEDTISIKLRGPKHGDGVPESDQCCNIHYIPFSGKKDGKVFGKQCPHTKYCDFGKGNFDLGDIRNKWIGVKAIEWNEGNGVHFQTWVDLERNDTWQLWAEIVDNGDAGDCEKDNKKPFVTSPPKGHHDVLVLLRVDTADIEATDISLREITPPAAG